MSQSSRHGQWVAQPQRWNRRVRANTTLQSRATLHVFVLMLLLLAASLTARAYAATVATDKADYSPGETVLMSGADWEAGETVSLYLHEEPMVHDDLELTAVADENGYIVNDEFVVEAHDAGAAFTLTATGLSSGLAAETTFTDSPPTSSCSTAADCDDGNPCTNDACGPNNQCQHNSATNGTSCSDGNACNGAETCQGGTCRAGTALADGISCDDGNACTQTDTCQGGTCTGTNPVVCTAADQCHVAGTCNPGSGQCSNPTAPDGTSCSDGNACTQTDTCLSGSCSGGNPVVCTASDQCHDIGICNTATGACSNPAKPDGTTCSDGNACTQVDACASGRCVGGSPKVCNDNNICTDDSCNPQSGACVYVPDPSNESCQASITSSSLCPFDVDSGTTGDQFRLILTPDQNNPSAWKLNASNPGQFYYNAFYFGTGNETLTITLPYPFVTHGAVPIHIYTSVTTASANGQTCLVPGTEVANRSNQVTLPSYSSSPTFGSTATVAVSLPDLPGGFAYINIHLDYGLKGTTNYSKDANNNAIDATSFAMRIPDKQSYTFADSAAGMDTAQSENSFKRDPGIGGLVQKANGDPVVNAQVQIYDSSNKLMATVYTDQDGWYMWQYKYTGKAASFTVQVSLPSSTVSQTVTLKSNSFVIASFIVS